MSDDDTAVAAAPVSAILGGDVGVVRPRDFVSREPFKFDCGAEIPEFTLRYETYGELNAAGTNAIFICHALSGDHHCAGRHAPEDRKPGWWDNIIGPGKPFDTRRYFVICANCLGGCRGSTGPTSVNPRTGRRYNLDFPALTIRDMVRAHARLVEHLGVKSLAAVVGGSMGGMMALQWGIDFPEHARSIIALATTARQSAQAIAFNAVGRSAIMQDPAWNQGDYEPDKGPNVGLAVARMMAHITYLSNKSLDSKFGRARRGQSNSPLPGNGDSPGHFGVEFEVESYLQHQGQSFVNRFDANTYLYFTKALDRFDLHGPDERLEDAFAPMAARALVVGFTSDWLFPIEQNREIAQAMLRAGKRATYAEVHSDLGHDSFLLNSPDLYALLRSFLGAEKV
ncbi:MAG TPA: homoserine O-acetyltransferase [Opitutales bacterium]|nr:homoserine O-acetyltransferase [Opitutales bacterium]